MDDIFLKIIKGEIPSERLYEDEVTYAFLDINPNNKGHALVVPKIKYRNIFDIDAEAFAAMARTAHRIATAIKAATDADGVNIVMNNELAAGQVVFHAHIHVIPRFLNDGIFAKSKHTEYAPGEIETVAEKIRAELG